MVFNYDMRCKNKFDLFFIKIAIWQPWPYIGYCKNGPISGLFYKRIEGTSWLFEKNWFGSLWQRFWFIFISKCKKNSKNQDNEQK